MLAFWKAPPLIDVVPSGIITSPTHPVLPVTAALTIEKYPPSLHEMFPFDGDTAI